MNLRYSPRDFIPDQMEDYETDRIERDGSGSVIITLGDPYLLGLDVPTGAGAVILDFTTTTWSDNFDLVPRIRGRIRY
jgi:hypothetical protein